LEHHEDQGFITVPSSGRAHQPSARLKAIFNADSARARARGRRHTLVALLGGLGLPLWVADVWPGWIRPELRSVAAAAWALSFVAVLVALGAEAIAHLRRGREIAGLGPLPVLRSPAAACAPPAEEED
jgi:hypothetical protein